MRFAGFGLRRFVRHAPSPVQVPISFYFPPWRLPEAGIFIFAIGHSRDFCFASIQHQVLAAAGPR
jgi:hypothetical protein